MNADINAMQDPQELIDGIESEIRKETDTVSVEIEGFTADDFATEKPYIYILMNHGNSEPVLQGLRIKLKEQAKRCKIGARDFETMCKSVFAAHSDLLPRNVNATKNGFTGASEKFFDGQEIDFGSYEATDSGVNGSKFGVPYRVSTIPILITKRYQNILSECETADITFYRDGRWKTIRQVPLKDMSKGAKIQEILSSRAVNVPAGNRADSMAEYLSDFFDLNTREDHNIIPLVKTTDTIGWMPDGSFVPFDGDIEVDAMTSDQSLSSMSASLHSKGDPAVWLDAVRKLRKSADSTPINMVLASSFASVLVEPLGRLSGWIHEFGKGTSGKTISLRLAASIWGKNEVSDGWMRNMNSTKVGLEVLAGFARNLPLCLNELQTIQNLKDFDDIVYALVECSGKTRGAAGGGLRRGYTWRLFILSCGEMQIVTDASREGANSRVLEIMVDHMLYGDPEKSEPQRFCSEVLDKSYGHAGPMFVKGLKNEDMNALSEEFVQITSELIKAGKAPKQADTAALMLVADRLAEKYVFQDGVTLKIKDILPYLKDQETIDDNKKAYEVIRSMISEKATSFTMEKPEKYTDSKGVEKERLVMTPPRGDTLGKVSDNGNTVYFIKQKFDTMIKERGFDAKRVIAWCVEHGVVTGCGKYGHENQKQVVVYPGMNATWCYAFDLSDDKDPTQKTLISKSTNVTNDTYIQTELPF